MEEDKKIRCHHCEYFFVTWETKHPYGCRSMNFKGKQIPSVVVFRTSGKKCMMFKAKEKKTSDQS
jgi:hypothetical protein